MSEGYRTVFEVSYFSNGTLFLNLVALFAVVCVAGVASLIRGRMSASFIQRTQRSFWGFFMVLLVLLLVCLVWLVSNLHSGFELTHALRSRYCRVVEGTVQVPNREKWGGHGADCIRIAHKDFSYSYYDRTLGYNRTISHSGELRDGVTARLHYLGHTILKVEVKP